MFGQTNRKKRNEKKNTLQFSTMDRNRMVDGPKGY